MNTRLPYTCLALALLFLGTKISYAQPTVADYKGLQKETFVYEAFDSNSLRLPLPQAMIAEGVLIVSDRINMDKPITAFTVRLDPSRDFEIELTASATSLILPGQIHWNHYLWEINATQGAAVYLDGSQIKYTGNAAGKNIFSKYLIRRSGNTCYYYVDDKLVGSTSYVRPSEGDNLTLGFSGKINVDRLIVSYLNKEDPGLAINKEEEVRSAEDLKGKKTGISPGGKFYCLIIGVSQYNEPRLYLENPVKDAMKFKDILVNRYVFTDSTCKVLLNPTRQKILAELYSLRKLVGPNDNLLIFYAGHGFWDKDARQGYWWAKDAMHDDPSTWLSNSDLREQIRGIKSAHTLLISDACFSGGIFRTRSGDDLINASKDIQILYQMPSRRAITSGTMTTVPDNSVFMEYLMKRLAENQVRFISSQQLFDSFRAAVINNSSVVPQDGVIAETGDEGGDFIFILKN
jgi:hypothetical protein